MKQAFAAAVLALAACSNTPPISPPPSVPVSSPTQTADVAEASASPTVVPSPAITCGHTAGVCDKAIGLVRDAHPHDVAQAHAIIVEDVCPPPSICDRLYPFDSLVVLVPFAQARATVLAFEVTGISGPERVEPFSGALPAHIAARVATAGG